MHYSSNWLDKVLYMFWTESTIHHQEYLNTVHTQQVFVMLVLLVSASVADAKQARETHQYRNTKEKLYKTNAAIWYNKICGEFHPDQASRRQQN